jgi:hypothetical protein
MDMERNDASLKVLFDMTLLQTNQDLFSEFSGREHRNDDPPPKISNIEQAV